MNKKEHTNASKVAAKTKLDELRLALKQHIENKKGNLSSIADDLVIHKGELSKILSLKVLPSIERIFFIEHMLGLNIIQINRVETQEKSHEEGDDVVIESVYFDIKAEFGTLYDDMLVRLEESLNGIIDKNLYMFECRKKKTYVSINLKFKHNKIGGVHIMTHRFSLRDKRLALYFIAPDQILEKMVSYDHYHLEKTNLPTIHIPSRASGLSENEFKLPGQPVLQIKKLTGELIEQVCDLAMKVYEIQLRKL